jgi:hypothetical protein
MPLANLEWRYQSMARSRCAREWMQCSAPSRPQPNHEEDEDEGHQERNLVGHLSRYLAQRAWHSCYQEKACGVAPGFLNNLYCLDTAFITDGFLEQLPTPSRVGETRVGGVDISKPRMRTVLSAVLALACSPNGFTVSELAAQVQSRNPQLNHVGNIVLP